MVFTATLEKEPKESNESIDNNNLLYNKKAPTNVSAFHLTGNYLLSQGVSTQVSLACIGLTTVFGMGTGGTL